MKFSRGKKWQKAPRNRNPRAARVEKAASQYDGLDASIGRVSHVLSVLKWDRSDKLSPEECIDKIDNFLESYGRDIYRTALNYQLLINRYVKEQKRVFTTAEAEEARKYCQCCGKSIDTSFNNS